MSDQPLLALDFDGVVVDALSECATVTWFSTRTGRPRPPDTLAHAVELVPEKFTDTFARIRPYCRTMADFMVALHWPDDPVDATAFTRVRGRLDERMLLAQAATGERRRAHWRRVDPLGWLAAHHVHTPTAKLLTEWRGPTAIVSAKDVDSIAAILNHHHLTCDHIIGQATDKAAALRALTRDGTRAVFIDDNLDNADRVGTCPQVRSYWAMWGYHTPEDVRRHRTTRSTSTPLTDDHLHPERLLA